MCKNKQKDPTTVSKMQFVYIIFFLTIQYFLCQFTILFIIFPTDFAKWSLCQWPTPILPLTCSARSRKSTKPTISSTLLSAFLLRWPWCISELQATQQLRCLRSEQLKKKKIHSTINVNNQVGNKGQKLTGWQKQ